MAVRRLAPTLLALALCSASVLPSAVAQTVYGGGGEGWDGWSTVVDGVMGGLSSGMMDTDGDVLVFSGDIVLDGGGFSSISKRGLSHDLSAAAGFLITLDALPEGSAPLALDISLDVADSFWSHGATFALQPGPPGAVQTIFVPMESFTRAQWRGLRCQGDCELDPSAVRSIALYVLFQEGPFELRIHSIETLASADDAPEPSTPEVLFSSPAAAADFLQTSAARASGAYDYGYPELGVAVYAAAMDTVMAASGPSEEVKAAMCSGLAHAAAQGGASQETSWILRRALDAGIAELQGAPRPSADNYPAVAQGSWLDAISSAAECPASLARGIVADTAAATTPRGDSRFSTVTAVGPKMGSLTSEITINSGN